MPLTAQTSPRCSLYLVTPLLSAPDAHAFVKIFAELLRAVPIACALVRLTADAQNDAEAAVARFVRITQDADCALLIENEAWLAARLGADGVHIAGAGRDLAAAIERLKPERIVGVGSLRTRDEAMTAGEMGADYVMFGEPQRGARAMGLTTLTDRVAWWAEIFETPCVAYADSIEAVAELAAAGADFVAVGDPIWGSPSPAAAAREAQALISAAGVTIP
jgi:thiamine-phosphate pyrophosphorylase